MNSYFYPTLPGWFEKLLESWKSSGKRELSFPFLWFKPTTLPEDKNATFWMYLYYTETQTEEIDLQRAVKFRVRVIEHSFKEIAGPAVHTIRDSAADAKVWFRCDVVEELRREDGELLRASDFEHAGGVSLLQAVRNSIAPVNRNGRCISVQKTAFSLND
ncbi:hypothetical protein JCM17961_50920 [Endothiovibrio diazotrophicus]